ncbi:MAG: GNAT family N-acetyltransferase [Propionibacteriales bacterium]|nr:GNAT family N-acetyltransferase [Propionibacteriales bacterium]
MRIRPITDADAVAVLELNEESVKALSPLDGPALAQHLGAAAHCVVCELEGAVAAFAIAYAPLAAYASINYEWFTARYDDFLYLDRIAVSPRFRRRGVATAVYDAIEAEATRYGRMVCEVNSDPPNPGSLAFHRARGYRELGYLTQTDGHETVMLEKPL